MDDKTAILLTICLQDVCFKHNVCLPAKTGQTRVFSHLSSTALGKGGTDEAEADSQRNVGLPACKTALMLNYLLRAPGKHLSGYRQESSCHVHGALL